MSESEGLLETGSRDGYSWLVSGHTFHDLLHVCPEIVVGKYVAITSLDSGAWTLNEEQEAAGWIAQDGLVYSPRIPNASIIPWEYFSEIYIFERTPAMGALADPKVNIFERGVQRGQVHAFVNFDFGLHDADYSHLAELFWLQLAWIKPESYVAENDYLTFVTSNHQLFALAHKVLSHLPDAKS